MRPTSIYIEKPHPVLSSPRQMISYQRPQPRRNSRELHFLKITLHLILQTGLKDPQARAEKEEIILRYQISRS